MLDIYSKPLYSDRIRCENKYWGVRNGRNDASSTPAILCTIAIIFLAALIEAIVHIEHNNNIPDEATEDEEQGTATLFSGSTETLVPASPILDQPQPAVGPLMEEQKRVASTKAARPRERAIIWCSPSPSQGTRYFRLFLATFFSYFSGAALYTRIDFALKKPYIDPDCARYVDWPGPNWAAIAILNIIPCVCVAFAVLRAFVDCLLGCSGKSLTYTRRWRAFPWMPFMPLFMIGVLAYYLFKGVRWPVVWVMRKTRASKQRKMMATGDEETNGLMEHMDEEKDIDGHERSSPSHSRKASSDDGEKGDKIV